MVTGMMAANKAAETNKKNMEKDSARTQGEVQRLMAEGKKGGGKKQQTSAVFTNKPTPGVKVNTAALKKEEDDKVARLKGSENLHRADKKH
jgi:hypothetical protein